ncbi:hypothetical protein PHMEG_0004555 [Phytophthora megakarya]|uniref:Uncharacterized protein n=1 Tax=Phytophthora megakarya TaxID=4795 RepID=A0A225WTM9_9STRA|nr:hypothetical protein PHMEG_0004555 [Phytophthora megakarya]
MYSILTEERVITHTRVRMGGANNVAYGQSATQTPRDQGPRPISEQEHEHFMIFTCHRGQLWKKKSMKYYRGGDRAKDGVCYLLDEKFSWCTLQDIVSAQDAAPPPRKMTQLGQGRICIPDDTKDLQVRVCVVGQFSIAGHIGTVVALPQISDR